MLTLYTKAEFPNVAVWVVDADGVPTSLHGMYQGELHRVVVPVGTVDVGSIKLMVEMQTETGYKKLGDMVVTPNASSAPTTGPAPTSPSLGAGGSAGTNGEGSHGWSFTCNKKVGKPCRLKIILADGMTIIVDQMENGESVFISGINVTYAICGCAD